MNNTSDDLIVSASIHPGIGIARVGNSEGEFFIGPELTTPPREVPGFYRDETGALKRQAARFRIYGRNAAGQVVRELTVNDADTEIQWTAHLANKKAQWYRFQAALDIPDTANLSVPQRNAAYTGSQRSVLAVDPGPRSITGASVSGGPEHVFDTGEFLGTIVPLGEIRTDEAGRLIVLGGTGVSASPSGAPLMTSDPNTFCNSDGWYDDVSDGPVTAAVSIAGRAIPVDPAWVIVAPPNYAPDIIGWRTMHDCMTDVFTRVGWLEVPDTISFTNHVLPILSRLSNLQWVNKGFAAMFGIGGPMNFEDHAFLEKLACTEGPNNPLDPYVELRQTILNAFRPQNTVAEEPRVWPWIYGDAYGSSTATSPENALALPGLQKYFLTRWVSGDFVNDWNPNAVAPKKLEDVPAAERPAMLDKAALHFCLADAFHPGCEMTWPVRHSSMYSAPFRFRHRAPGNPEPDCGQTLNTQNVKTPNGPLYAQGPGDITRWMAVPWQVDTAFCRSGYNTEYDPYLPSFWAARVPNQVLAEDDYRKVTDTSLPRAKRIQAFHNREQWVRLLTGNTGLLQMAEAVAGFGKMGLVEARKGVSGDPLFPETLFVESLSEEDAKAARAHAARLAAKPPVTEREHKLRRAGWESEEQLEDFRKIRIRFRT
jgi:hypothetical protein